MSSNEWIGFGIAFHLAMFLPYLMGLVLMTGAITYLYCKEYS